MVVELSPAESTRRRERREVTNKNIEFLRMLPRREKSRIRRLASANGTKVRICDGRQIRNVQIAHLREEVHVLVNRPGNNTIIPDVHYAIYYGRLDITRRRRGVPTTLQVGFQDNLYDTYVSAVTTLVRMCLPLEIQSPPGKPLQTSFLEKVVDTA